VRYGPLFIALSASILWLAFIIGGAGLVLLWPALSFALLGAAYLAHRPTLLGKRLDGTLAWWAYLLFAPYLMLTWSIWHTKRMFGREDCANEIVPGLWVGRRPFSHELPEGVRVIVDITAEFPAPAAIRRHPGYLCIPTLDGMPPDMTVLCELLDTLRDKEGIFVHCAFGHGRSATVAAALLIARRLAGSVAEAEAQLRQRRPGIRLNDTQRRYLEEILLRMQA